MYKSPWLPSLKQSTGTVHVCLSSCVGCIVFFPGDEVFTEIHDFQTCPGCSAMPQQYNSLESARGFLLSEFCMPQGFGQKNGGYQTQNRLSSSCPYSWTCNEANAWMSYCKRGKETSLQLIALHKWLSDLSHKSHKSSCYRRAERWSMLFEQCIAQKISQAHIPARLTKPCKGAWR